MIISFTVFPGGIIGSTFWSGPVSYTHLALEQIGACEKCATYENADKFGVLPLDVTVKKGEALFPRIDVEKEIEGKPGSYFNNQVLNFLNFLLNTQKCVKI